MLPPGPSSVCPLSRALFLFSPAFPLGALIVIATAEFGVVVALVLLLARSRVVIRRVSATAVDDDINEIAGVLIGVVLFLDKVAEGRVGRVDELESGEATLVADAGVGASLKHHLDKGVAELALGGGFRVEPADGGVEGGITLETVDRIAFEVGLVEEEVNDVVCTNGVLILEIFVYS